ncbi:MAG: hypothetical protein JXD18_09995 [Anaerolineae bacterium]|nr:hypothetical protein [Anaerolineae bacterium]
MKKRIDETWPFWVAIAACIQFVVLTAVAMLIYPGGSIAGVPTRHYSFFRNFFSELGMFVTGGGQPNLPSALLFIFALMVAGLGLVTFFLNVPRFFRQQRVVYVLSILGSIAGIFAGLSFIGVAFTPADVFIEAHAWFVLAAFQAFPVAAAFYTVAILLNPAYPNRYAAVYGVFAVLLVAYVALLRMGPGFDTPEGLLIQATGQKVIVYVAILCTLAESYGALRLSRGAAANSFSSRA